MNTLQRLVGFAAVFVVMGCGGDVQQSVEKLKSDDATLRAEGARQLAEMDGERSEAVPDLIAALDDESQDVRRLTAFALGRLGAEVQSAVPALVRTLDDTDANVRFAAAFALAQVDPTRTDAVPVLITAVRRRELRAFVALQMLGPAAQEAADAVAAALHDPNPVVREQAAKTLERLGHGGASDE